jgi:hypothetical protein
MRIRPIRAKRLRYTLLASAYPSLIALSLDTREYKFEFTETSFTLNEIGKIYLVNVGLEGEG